MRETSLPRPPPGAIEEGVARIHLPPKPRPRRKMFRRLPFGAVPGFGPICMDTNDHNTVECGFRQRLLRKVPTPDRNELKRFSLFCRKRFSELFRKVRPLDFEEWLDTTSYNEDRKDQLRLARESLHGGLPTKRQCQHIDTFVKSEFYTQFKHCRLINSRSDAFKSWAGPYFKAIENEVYSYKWFIKHVPVPERPQLINSLKKANKRYYMTDFTAFESHFVPEVMRSCELQLYRHCLSNYPQVVSLLDRTLAGKNLMRTRSGLFASVDGRRMSGDMCTSLGNGITNCMLIQFIAHCKGGNVDGFVEGDDGLFSSDVEFSPVDFEKLGFTIKIEQVNSPQEGSFCGMLFSDTEQIIKDPRKFLMGFGWTHSFISAGHTIMMELLRAKALSACYEAPSCPIVGVLARIALEITTGYTPRFVDDGFHVVPHDFQVPEFCPTAETRELFAQEYGIDVHAQLEIERLITTGSMDRIADLIKPHPDSIEYCSKFIEVT